MSVSPGEEKGSVGEGEGEINIVGESDGMRVGNGYEGGGGGIVKMVVGEGDGEGEGGREGGHHEC